MSPYEGNGTKLLEDFFGCVRPCVRWSRKEWNANISNSQLNEGARYTPWYPLRDVQIAIRTCVYRRKEKL